MDEVLSDAGGKLLLRGTHVDGSPTLALVLPGEVQDLRNFARCRLAFDLARSANCPAVPSPREIIRSPGHINLLINDPGGNLLSTLIPQDGMRLDHLIDASLALSTALRQLHRAGILHRDLRPSTILLTIDGARAHFPALDLATRQIGLTGFVGDIDGAAMSHVAPELAGRMDVPADERADLYSLGATLFHMACGRPPFAGSDAAELAYAHMAMPVPNPVESRHELPPVYGQILLKLLQKDPDDRYDSAYDLERDVLVCAEQFRKTGAIRSFHLSRRGVSPNFRLSDRLYGRDRERSLLRSIVHEGLLAGQRTLVTVSGPSGIGKSAFVTQMQWDIGGTGAAFHAGKFDKFRQDQPYGATSEVVESMVRALLRMERSRVESARAEIQKALGAYGKLLTDLVPDLGAFLGPQSECDDVLPSEAARRFNEVVGRFVRVFATKATPLIVFLDDVQWADQASLNLLSSLAEMSGLSHFMLILGYRSNEMPASHAAFRAIDSLTASARRSLALELEPLGPGEIAEFVSDTLGRHDVDCEALSALVHRTAAGNIFFAREYLSSLHIGGSIRFDDAAGAWWFDLEAIRSTDVPSGVAALLIDRLDVIPEPTLSLLDAASCIGNSFDLATLMHVHPGTATGIALNLVAAIDASIIVPVGEEHLLVTALGGTPNGTDEKALTEDAALMRALYRFRHDQVRTVVHDRLNASRRARLHLQIGRLLLSGIAPVDLPTRAVEIFRHYVFASGEITNADERLQCARLGLMAANRAIAGLAFETAQQFLRAASDALPEDAWANSRDLKVNIELGLAECALALSDGASLDRIATDFLKHVTDPLPVAQMTGYQIRKMSTEVQFNEATDLFVKAARRFAVSMPRRPNLGNVMAAVLRLLAIQGRRDVMCYADLPEAIDPQARAAVQLLNQSAGAAYFAEPNLFPLIGLTGTRLSLRYGLSPQAPYAFAIAGLVLSGPLGMIRNGYRYGELAVRVAQRYGASDRARAEFVVNSFIRHLKEPLSEVVEKLKEGWAHSRDAGEQENATYSAGVLLYTDFLSGRWADTDQRYNEVADYLRQVHMPHVKECFIAWLQLFDLLKMADMAAELSGPQFDYPSKISGFLAVGNSVQISISSIAAGVLDYLSGRFERAEDRFALAAKHDSGIVGQVLVPGLAFFRALNAYRLAEILPRHAARLRRLARRLARKTHAWAEHSPNTFRHRADLLDAEAAVAAGDIGLALVCLHRVADLTEADAPLYAYLAQLRRAEILREKTLPVEARRAALVAQTLAANWGAPGLAATVARRFDLPEQSQAGASGASATRVEVDLKGFMDVVGVIASEKDRDGLLLRVLATIVTTANADFGLLALKENDWTARIRAVRHNTGRAELVDWPLEEISASARRAIESVLLIGAPLRASTAAGRAEGAQGQSEPRAMLCVPIERNGITMGAVYLENRASRHVFTGGRESFVRAFAHQAAIALENARLLVELQSALHLQTRQTEANRRFVPEHMMRALSVSNITDVALSQASEQEMTVVFADLRGFTATASQLSPKQTVMMINRYLDHVQPGIAANGGFVVQYFGDGLIALFPDRADDALFGAIAMMRGLDGYNRSRGEFPELRSGIGIHHGPVVLGVIGDADHIQCTVIGDAINVASRIEAQNKEFLTNALISDACLARLEQRSLFDLRSLGPVVLRGKLEPVTLFELAGSALPDLQRTSVISMT